MVFAVYTPRGRVYTPVVAYMHLWLRIYTCGLYTNLLLWRTVLRTQRTYDTRPWCFWS